MPIPSYEQDKYPRLRYSGLKQNRDFTVLSPKTVKQRSAWNRTPITLLTNSPNPSHVHRLIICFSFSANRRGVVDPTRANANTQTMSLRRNVYAQLLQDTRRLLLNTLTRIVTTATSASEFNARFPTDTSFFSSQLEVFLLRYAYFSRIFDCSAGWCVR